jgi:regulator of RNase E activity RraA
MKSVLNDDLLWQLRGLSSCVLASAIESCEVRLRNTGFADRTIRCLFPELPAIVGHAVTARVRTAEPPMEGGTYYDHGRAYYDQSDWWKYILTVEPPRIVVIEDLDQPKGVGAFLGEVHVNILRALDCAGAITDGNVRDVPQAHASSFQIFAGGVSVSHAYAHILDFGGPIEVAGLNVGSGDLIHGDLHGVQTVPVEIVNEILLAARKILRRRRNLADLCRSADFSLEKLQTALQETQE